MLKALLKLWPALIPIVIYIIWYLIKKRKKPQGEVIEGEFKVIEKNKQPGMFCLENNVFVAVLYLTFTIAIFGMIFIVLAN